MHRRWQFAVAVAGSIVFVVAAALPVYLLLTRNTVPDEWSHRDLASHLKAKGIVVDVHDTGNRAAIFTEPSTGARVAVIRAPDAKTSKKAQEYQAWDWAESFSAGPFLIGSVNDAADVSLCRRIKHALR